MSNRGYVWLVLGDGLVYACNSREEARRSTIKAKGEFYVKVKLSPRQAKHVAKHGWQF